MNGPSIEIDPIPLGNRMQRGTNALRSPSYWHGFRPSPRASSWANSWPGLWPGLGLWVAAMLVLCAVASECHAQFILNPNVAEPAAAPFEPTPTPSSVNRKLKQWDALVADKAWDDAIDLLEQLQTEQGDQWIETSTGTDRFYTLSQACQKQLASLTAEGLAAYRQRVDSSAKQLLEKGRAKLDPKPLNRVVNEYFASSYGDDALLALGEIAFAKGDMVAARRAWLQTNARLAGPYGEPIEIALSNIDPNADPTLLTQLWLDAPRPSDLNTYPDSDLRLADLLARLIITSIQERELVRAKAELRLLEAIAPESTGWLAGREQPLVSSLKGLYEASLTNDGSDLPSQSRIGEMQAWQWPQSLPFVAKSKPLPNQQTLQRVIRLNGNGQRIQFFQPVGRAAAVSKDPTHYPVVANNIIAITTSEGLKGWQVSDGKEIEAKQLAQQPLQPPKTNSRQTTSQQLRIINGRVVVNARSLSAANRNRINAAWPGSLTAWQDQFLYASQPQIKARTTALRNTLQRRLNNLPTRLLGIHPSQDGKVVLELSSTEASSTIQYHFAGPPTIRGNQLYVVLSNVSARRELAVACYSVSQGRLAWVTPIGSSEGGMAPQHYVSLQVMLGRDTAYLATDQGAVVALNSTSGEVRWLARYPRKAQKAFVANRDLTPRMPILAGDRLYVGPADSQFALALNTGTGRIVWSGEPIDPKARLVAVTAKTVLFAGEQVEGLDPITGQRRYLYPESKHAGLRGKGVGLLAGDEYFWPTRNEIQVLDLDTGRPTRPPIDLMSVGSEGAILTRAGDRIVVAGPTRMNVLGGQPAVSSEPIPQLSRLMEWWQPTGGPMLSKNTSNLVTP